MGEDGAAADIGRVTVSTRRRLVTFQIQIRNRPDYLRDMAIQILVDADQNPAPARRTSWPVHVMRDAPRRRRVPVTQPSR
jgi:hypothetical protein